MQVLYTASARATGDGRNGHVRTSDGTLDLDLAIPKEMGGAGDAANPEQLFAAGYAACFHSALRTVARKARADVSASVVEAEVGIGANGSGGFGLTVALVVDLPALDRAAAEQLVGAAHQVCPYSNATRGNIDVALTVREVASA
ncbi:organic hydroperoxide resistance protein [Micromonospora sp. KC213]|uniref:organic hydroperoxide resistance protein n=1 Tax=Micromonospora sp. KC213 TaxID=2530378 RepID=UPI001045D001|nr:organic hydroperoxide resistance protein [Micromonospora sp. KC213]TDC43705.1 organic hydroperoxide resistance protein [Micromonospora sp. KC213]